MDQQQQPITPSNVKDVELDANKALQVMLNGLDVARRTGKYTFEESYYITQTLYGLQALSEAQRKAQESKDGSSASTSQESSATPTSATPVPSGPNEKVMRITWPEDFTINDYIQVVIRHLEIGQQRGAFSFTDSALIGRAIELFQQPAQAPSSTTSSAPASTEQKKEESTPTSSEPQTVVL